MDSGTSTDSDVNVADIDSALFLTLAAAARDPVHLIELRTKLCLRRTHGATRKVQAFLCYVG